MTSLAGFAIPDETALQLYARNYVEPVPTGVGVCSTVIPGQLLEIAGRSGCGKSTFLLQAALFAILPEQIGGSPLGGRSENVLYIDLDQKFDILRLMEMLHARIQPLLSGRDVDQQLDRIIHACLQRFHLITCSSSLEMLAVFKTVQPFIAQLQAEQGLRLLLVDNVSAYYWQDYPVKAQPREQGQVPSDLTLQAVHGAAASMLRNLAKQSKVAVIVTKHCFKSLSQGESEEVDYWQLKEVMCKPWTDVVSQRIFFRKSREDCVVPAGSSFLAKWDKPSSNRVTDFGIVEGGIVC